MQTQQRIAILGMGVMGQTMSYELATKEGLSNPIIIWNRTHSKATETAARLGRDRACAVRSLRHAIEAADVIWSCLYTEEAVREVFEEILCQERLDLRGKMFLECSTVGLDATADLTKRIVERGAEFIAMPGKTFRSVVGLLSKVG